MVEREEAGSAAAGWVVVEREEAGSAAAGGGGG